MKPTKCSSCSGAGFLYEAAGQRCKDCNGTGKTPPQNTATRSMLVMKETELIKDLPPQSKPKTSECKTCGGKHLVAEQPKVFLCPECEPTELCKNFNQQGCTQNCDACDYRQPTEQTLSNPQCIEDVLMQVGAYGSGDSKYVAQAIREWMRAKMPKDMTVEFETASQGWDSHTIGLKNHMDGYNQALADIRRALGVGE
jgi:hypothetical protein